MNDEKKYELYNKLGSGSWGIIYSLKNDTNKVIKVFTDVYKTPFESTVELDILFSLNHPNILKGIELANPKECNVEFPCYILSKVDKMFESTLPNTINFVKLASDIISALKFLHDNNYYHLDITSSNCMYYENETRGVLIDFGLSAAVQRDINGKLQPYASKDMRITPVYRPPECFKEHMTGDRIYYVFTEKSDIWSLGMVFLEMFTKTTVFIASEHSAPDTYKILLKEAKKTKNKKKIEKLKSDECLWSYCVQDQIPKLFDEDIRKEKIKSFIKHNCPKELDLWVELLYHMLDPNEETRWDLEKIINYQLFKDKILIEQVILIYEPIINELSDCKCSFVEYMNKYLLQFPYYPLELYFTCLDNTLRSFNLIDESYETIKNYTKICLGLSIRLYEFYNNLTYDSCEDIHHLEIEVIKKLNYKIRHPQMYNVANNRDELLSLYSSLIQSNYKNYTFEIKKHPKMGGDKNMTIEEFNNILKQQDIIINKGKAIICDLLYRKYSDKDISLYGLSFEYYAKFLIENPWLQFNSNYIENIANASVICAINKFYDLKENTEWVDDINSIKIENDKKFINIEDWRNFYNTYLYVNTPITKLYEKINKLPDIETEKKDIKILELFK